MIENPLSCPQPPSPISHDLIQSASSMLVKSSRKLLDLSPLLQQGLKARGADKELPQGVENKLKYNCGVISHGSLGGRKCLTETPPPH